MEERVLKEIINDFYKKEMLDENIEESKKQKLYDKKMDEIRLEIDSLASDIEKELRDNGENLGTGELKKIRHNIVLALDRMNKRGLTILNGSGKIDSEAVKKIIEEENLKVEAKSNNRESIENPIDISEVKPKEIDETGLIEKLKELDLSEEDFEYYSGAIERERERERKRQQDIETMGEEKAKAKALEDFSKDTDAQCDALAVGVVNSGSTDDMRELSDIRAMRAEIQQYSEIDLCELPEEKRQKIIQNTELIKIKIHNLGIRLADNGVLPSGIETEYYKKYREDHQSIEGKSFENDHLSFDTYQTRQQITADVAEGKFHFTQPQKKYNEIGSIEEITSLIAEGVSIEEVVNALKIFAHIVTESSNINDLERKIDDEIGKKENIGEPLSKDEILILGTLKKMDYKGKSLDEILQSEEMDELIDWIEEIAGSIEAEHVHVEGKNEDLITVDEASSEAVKRYITPSHEKSHVIGEKRTIDEDVRRKEMSVRTGNKISDKNFTPYFEEQNELLRVSLSKEKLHTDISMSGKFGGYDALHEMRDNYTAIIEEPASVTPPPISTSTTPPHSTPTSIVEEMTVDDSGVTQEGQSEPSKNGTWSASTVKALVERQAEVRKMLEATGILGQIPEGPTVEKPDIQGEPISDKDEKSGGEPEEH